MSNQQLSSNTSSGNNLKAMLSGDRMREQFAAALPKHLTAERFVRVAITALSRTPKLLECTHESFFKCLLDLSAMGLEPDGRRAHLIPYGKECTLVLDYKGLVELVRRSGDVVKIHADVVCDQDHFAHSMGEVVKHTFDLRAPRGSMYAAYAQVTLKDGSVQAAIMSKDEIDGIRKRSRASSSGPWVTDYNEMAKKTAFRRLTKWLTLSPEIRESIDRADAAEFQGMRNVTPQVNVPARNPYETAPAIEQPAETQPAQVMDPEPANAAPAPAYFEGFKVLESKPDVVKPWKMWRLSYTPAGGGAIKEAATFSDTIGALIESLQGGDQIHVEVSAGAKGDQIESLSRAEEPQTGEGW